MCVSHAKFLEIEGEPLLWSGWRKLNDWQWTDKPNPCSCKEIPSLFLSRWTRPFPCTWDPFLYTKPRALPGVPKSLLPESAGGGGVGVGETKEFRHLCVNWIYVSDLSILTVKKESWRRFGWSWCRRFGGDEEVGLEAKKGHELLFAGSFHRNLFMDSTLGQQLSRCKKIM